MKYQLPHPKFDKKTFPISRREIKKQDIPVVKAKHKQLKEFAVIDKIIQKQEIPDYFVLRKLPENMGKGLFLHPKEQPLKKGSIIAAYAGKACLTKQNVLSESDYIFAILSEIKLTKKEQQEIDPKSRFHPNRHYSLEIDANNSGNFTRYINHSDKPNVEAQFMQIPKNSYGVPETAIEVVYVAKKTIHPGEQLLVSYEEDGDSYWGTLNIDPVPVTPKTFTVNASLKIEKK